MKNLHSIKDILACPDCHTSLSSVDGKLRCGQCNRDFRVINDVPVLFSPKSGQSIAHEGQKAYAEHDSSSLKNRIKRLLPLPNFIVVRPTLHDRLRNTYIFGAPPEAMILNLGSGVQNELTHPGLINLDIYPHGNTDVAGDAHQLPFIDSCLDGVWLCAVMEHLNRPFIVSNEVCRILKPGGFVLVTVPFIYPHHGAPHDFFRYTLDGLRSVFSNLHEVEGGTTGTGPVGTWAQMTMALTGSFSRKPSLSYAFRFMTGWALYPFVFVDRLMKKRFVDSPVCGGVCYMGRK